MFDKLKSPFPPDRVSWRVGSTTQDKKKGLAFGYIDARDVMQRLDEVCGPENWQNTYTIAGTAIVCNIGIRDGAGDWVWKADGAGATDVEAEKGMMSDAFKRAAVRFGIGRYLYDIPATWVAIEPMGKSFRIAEGEYPRLEKVLAGLKQQNHSADKKPEQVKPATKQSIMPDDFTARVEYMVDCRDAIAAMEPGQVVAWWSSDEQKEARRKHQLDQSQIDALKQAVINRRDATKAAA